MFPFHNDSMFLPTAELDTAHGSKLRAQKSGRHPHIKSSITDFREQRLSNASNITSRSIPQGKHTSSDKTSSPLNPATGTSHVKDGENLTKNLKVRVSNPAPNTTYSTHHIRINTSYNKPLPNPPRPSIPKAHPSAPPTLRMSKSMGTLRDVDNKDSKFMSRLRQVFN
ncbi:hypothetical protein BZG36_05597, partial [Bifiguratus adelaidae]